MQREDAQVSAQAEISAHRFEGARGAGGAEAEQEQECVIFLGIIDTLIPYNFRKQMEVCSR